MTSKQIQKPAILAIALVLGAFTSVWSMGQLYAEAAPYVATSSSATASSLNYNGLPEIVGEPIGLDFSVQADTSVTAGGGVVAMVTYAGNGTVYDPYKQHPNSTVSKMTFRKCTFGVSVLSGDSIMPITSSQTFGVSYQAADAANFTEYTNVAATNFFYDPQSEYYKAFAFSPTYAKVNTSASPSQDMIQFYMIGFANTGLQVGQRFSVDAFGCEVTVQGWSGTYYFGNGKGFGSSSTPALLTYIVSAGSSSSTSTTSTSSSTSSAPATNARIPLYRFYKASTGGHLYTVSESEKNKVIANLSSVYKFEGVRGQVLPGTTSVLEPDMVQVERFYNNLSGTHKYTYKPSEIKSLKSNKAFTGEGVRFTAFYKAKTGRLPMYEFFNTRTGGYFYTSSESEKNKVIANLPYFSYRGIAFYVLPKPI